MAVFVTVEVAVLDGVSVSVGVLVGVLVSVGVAVGVAITSCIVVFTKSVLIPSLSASSSTLFTVAPESVLNDTVLTSSFGANVPYVVPATN
jgi:hypothetical protein